MDSQLKSNLTSPKHWVRLVYMVLFAFFLYVASFVMSGLVVVQFVFSLLTGSDNIKLRAFGYSLTTYIQQALMFLSFNSEFKPFPFADWPDAPAQAEPAEEVAVATTAAPDPAPESAPTADTDASVEARVHPAGDPAAEDEPPLVDPEAEKRILS